MFNQTRRNFIKGVAYTSALSIGGISSLAMANSQKTADSVKTQTTGLPTCDISIPQEQTIGTEKVTLTNHTNRNVTINSISGAGLEHVNKHLTVKVNNLGKHADQGIVTLVPGEQLTFLVAALCTDECGNANNKNLFIPNVLAGQLSVSSDHPAFNGIIPLTVFETV